MSVEKITQTRYRCKCNFLDCKGKGKSWLSFAAVIPDRCRWCGRRTWNGIDQRKNPFITALGKTQSRCEWSKETGLSKQVIDYRLKAGWSEEKAVTTPVGKGKANA